MGEYDNILNKSLTDLLKEIEYKIVTFNVFKNGTPVISKTIAFLRIEEGYKDEEKFLLFTDGRSDSIYISKNELKSFICKRIVNDCHYIFHHEV